MGQILCGHRPQTIFATRISRELSTRKSRASKTTPGILSRMVVESAPFEATDIFSPLALALHNDPVQG